MGWVEYIEQPEVMRHEDGSMTAARFFKVWDTTPAAIIASPALVLNSAGFRLPTYGEYHIDYAANLPPEVAVPILAYYTVTQQGAVCYATAYYTNKPENRSHALTFQRVQVEVPRLVRREVRTAGIGSSQSGFEFVPELESVWTTVGRVQIRRTFTLRQANNPTIFDLQEAIVSRIGDLHGLNASAPPADPNQTNPQLRLYRFEGADIDAGNSDWVDVTYSWLYDAGVRVIDTTSNVRYPNLVSSLYLDQRFSVPPYEVVSVIPRQNVAPLDEVRHDFESKPYQARYGTTYDWKGLPGMRP